MKKSFKEIVQGLTAGELITHMVNGLKREFVTVDMNSFGHADSAANCFGCAATNTICSVFGRNPFLWDEIDAEEGRAFTIGTDSNFLFQFEVAIDRLRKGHFSLYNAAARRIGLPEIKNVDQTDRTYAMDNINYKQLLPKWEELASKQDLLTQ